MVYIKARGNPKRVVDINAMLLEAVNAYNNPQDEEAHLLEAIVPETVVEGHGAGTSSQASTQTSKSQSSPRSPEPINASNPFNDAGSVEDDHEEETSSQASGETSPLSPHWQYISSFLNNTSGVMINRDVGNIYRTSIRNVGSNNHYYRWVQRRHPSPPPPQKSVFRQPKL